MIDGDGAAVLRILDRSRSRKMESVSVSPKFQVVIPRRSREALGLKPRQRMHAVLYGDHVELIPLLPIAAARGILKGVVTDIERHADRL